MKNSCSVNNKVIKVFVLDHLDGFCRSVKEINAEDTLHEMYRLLHCDLVDARDIEVNGENFCIWFDEEFLLTQSPVATFLLGEPKKGQCQPICGSWMITRIGPEGETLGLTDEDIKMLWEYTDINGLKLHVAFKNGLFS